MYFGRGMPKMFKNSYFANSILSCLYSISSFREKIYQIPSSNKNMIVKAVKNIFKTIENQDSNNIQVENLLNLLFKASQLLSNILIKLIISHNFVNF